MRVKPDAPGHELDLACIANNPFRSESLAHEFEKPVAVTYDIDVAKIRDPKSPKVLPIRHRAWKPPSRENSIEDRRIQTSVGSFDVKVVEWIASRTPAQPKASPSAHVRSRRIAKARRRRPAELYGSWKRRTQHLHNSLGQAVPQPLHPEPGIHQQRIQRELRAFEKEIE